MGCVREEHGVCKGGAWASMLLSYQQNVKVSADTYITSGSPPMAKDINRATKRGDMNLAANRYFRAERTNFLSPWFLHRGTGGPRRN